MSARRTPAITWSNPADITYGTALSGTQLDATASVPGTFVYSPAANTVLNAGANWRLSVTFTPTDTTDYTTATQSVTVNVGQAMLTVNADAKIKTQGHANPSLTASYTGFVNGDTSAVLSGSPSLSTLATTSSPVVAYAITADQGTLSSANYSFQFVNSILYVTGASDQLTSSQTACR